MSGIHHLHCKEREKDQILAERFEVRYLEKLMGYKTSEWAYFSSEILLLPGWI